ncbi:hypothetical protein [Rubritalea tangerina]
MAGLFWHLVRSYVQSWLCTFFLFIADDWWSDGGICGGSGEEADGG